MRRSAVSVFFLLILAMMAMELAGCGGGSGANVGPAASIKVVPASLSLNRGDVVQAGAQIQDAQGNTVFNVTFTFNSSNANIFTVSSSGLVCAGQWDSTTTPIVCKTKDSNNNPLPLGTANLTASTTSGTILTSDPAPVTVHEHVDNITVSPLAPGCVSQGATGPPANNTVQFTATALSNSPAVCAPNPTPCALPNVGDFQWTLTPASVGALPTTFTGNQVTVTAAFPGSGSLVASLSGATSVPATFTTCPVASIAIHQSNPPTPPDTETSFTLAKAATVPLKADVLDSNGLPVNAFLDWISSQPVIANVNAIGQVTGNQPGTTSVVASCSPSSCNLNLNDAIYSNVVTATVSGTNVTTLFAASKQTPTPAGSSNSLVPIDTSANTAGTAIPLPADAVANSLFLNRIGIVGYLGSNKGLIVVDTVGNKVTTTISSVTGRVLAVSPDGSRVIVSDANNADPNKRVVYVFNQGTSAAETTLAINNATAADFAEDSSKAYIVAGNRLYIYDTSHPTFLHFVNLTGTSQDVSFLATGAMAYVAGAGDDVVGSCNDLLLTTVPVGTPSLIESAPNGLHVLDANPPAIDQIDVTSAGTCPATVSNSFASHTFPGVPAFTARQLLVTADSSKAIILSDQSSLLVYTLGATAPAGTTTTIPLTGGAHPLSGVITLDSAQLYVGADDNKVHRINLSTNTDVQQIPVSLCGTTACAPDFLAAKPATTISNPTVTSITVSPPNPTITVGQTQQFTATGTFSDGSTKDITSSVTWSSSSTTVATISTSGLATAVAAGSTTISAKSGSVTGSTNLTVKTP